jgi:hypothetical protein
MSTRQAWIFFVAAVALFAAAITLTGCAAHPAVPPATHEFVGPGHTPTSLTAVAKGLDGFILLSVIAVGVGIGLFFWLPTAHNASLALVFIGGGVEASSLATRVSLWLVPYVVITFIAAALAALIYEIVHNRATLEADVSAAKSDFETEVEKAAAAVKSGATTVTTEVKKV